MSGFIKELRRRRVFRVVAFYVVGAWVVLQVADLAFPGMQIPDYAIRYVWIGAITGFPIAVALGWLYDVSAGRILRTAPLGSDNPLQLNRADYTVLTVLFIATLALLGGVFSKVLDTRTLPTASEDRRGIASKSIAVLPFENLSGDASNDPFTMGMHDDLLTHIAKIGDIKVISRTSVVRLSSDISIREVGKLLGVATVLAGGIQRIGTQIRINAQLIDTASDELLWADSFEKELTTQNILAIQSEIAAVITGQLQATLSPQDEAKLEKLATQDFDAYEAYSLGRLRMGTRKRADMFGAIQYFEKAIRLDPQYTLAYVGIAEAYLVLNSYGHVTQDEALAKAEPALAIALRQDDEIGAIHTAIGLKLARQGDNVGAKAAFERAIKLDPNYATPYHWYGDVLVNATAEPETAIPLLQKARELDPLSAVVAVTLGEAFEAVGRFDEALAMYRKSNEIEPDFPGAYSLLGFSSWAVSGRADESVSWFRKTLDVDPSRETDSLGVAYLDLGDFDKAEYWINRSLRLHPDRYAAKVAEIILNRYRGEEVEALRNARQLARLYEGNNASLVTLVAYGRFDEALREFAPLYPELSCEEEPLVTRQNLSQSLNISLALHETGETECAAKLLDNALERVQQMPRFGSKGFGLVDVEIFARQGKTRLALDTLKQAIDDGYRYLWWAQTEGNRHVAALVDEAEFQKIILEVRADMAAQLERLREWEANGELAAIPE